MFDARIVIYWADAIAATWKKALPVGEIDYKCV